MLVRHGRTAWHAEGRYAGTADVPLDGLGLEQARRVADRFRESTVDVIYSSPLSRCLALAEMVAAAHHMEVIVDERLREIDLGRWDGMMLEDIVEKDGDILKEWTRNPTSVTIPDGETLMSVQERAMAWYDEASSLHSEGMIFASSHGGPIRAMLAKVIGLPLSNIFRLTVDLASVSVVNQLGKFSNLESLNERSHLDGME